MSSSTRSVDVLVLGAGLAGLAAATCLARAGCDVRVLEAQSRPGGRVLTVRSPLAAGLVGELGAKYVFGGHAVTRRYAAEHGLVLEPVVPPGTDDDAAYFLRGRWIDLRADLRSPGPFSLRDEEVSLGFAGLMKRYLGPAVVKLGDPTQPCWPDAAAAPLDRLSLAAHLRDAGASPDAVELLCSAAFATWGDGPEAFSTLAALRREVLSQRAYSTLDCFRDGTSVLPEALAAHLGPARMLYGHVARSIEQHAGGVRVICEQGVFEARTLVCAVPFSALRRIALNTPFSAGKRRAIDELPSTSVTRTLVQTRSRPWRGVMRGERLVTDLPIMNVFDASIRFQTERGLLDIYTTGSRARALGQLPEDERVAASLRYLEEVIPGVTGHVEVAVSKVWDDDPWAGGAFAWFRPGQVVELLPHVASVEGRIHFAGDHTSATPGWMEGALSSGERVAAEVLARSQMNLPLGT
jgi:monoamine oxidase